ncbi:hypothetical protein DV515_00010478, partial [Chloebia gouldiae]
MLRVSQPPISTGLPGHHPSIWGSSLQDAPAQEWVWAQGTVGWAGWQLACCHLPPPTQIPQDTWREGQWRSAPSLPASGHRAPRNGAGIVGKTRWGACVARAILIPSLWGADVWSPCHGSEDHDRDIPTQP